MKKEGFLKLLIPTGTVFISSACIMIIELVASRLIARHLGSSLYTWTSVIGVVLAGITIGNYLGGRIADKYQPRKALSAVFCLASIACVIIVMLNNFVGEWIWLWQLSWPVRVFSHVSIVFLVPSILLGTISPIVAKIALDQGLPTGRTVGDIYACGAAGSIAGTFLAGFLLIETMGTVAIIWTIAFILLGMSIAYRIKAWPVYLWAVILIACFFFGVADTASAKNLGSSLGLREKIDPTILYHDETPYCYVAVRQLSEFPDKREFLQDKLRHSVVYMGDLQNLEYFHTVIFACLTKALSRDKQTISTFSIGGGGYVFPQYLEQTYPGSRNVVAEIDPGVTEAAHEAFGLRRDTTIETVILDARNYVDGLLEARRQGREIPKFDFIYEDAFSDYNVPFQLVTKEFHDKIDALLAEDGAYMINMIDVLDIGYFLGAYVHTLRQTFPHVYVIDENGPAGIRTTFSIIASRMPIDIRAIMNECRPRYPYRYLEDSEIDALIASVDHLVLTDDYAPVDNLLAPVVRQSAKELLSSKYFTLAKEAKAKGDLRTAINYYTLAAENNASYLILSYNEVGLAWAGLQEPLKAAQAFQKAVDYYYKGGSTQKIIGSLHLNLGILYANMQDKASSEKHLKLAVERFREEALDLPEPDNHAAYSRMGEALRMLGRYEEAEKAFRKALDLDPENHQYYGNLIRFYVSRNQLSKAAALLREQLSLLEKQGDTQGAAQVRIYLQNILQKTTAPSSAPRI